MLTIGKIAKPQGLKGEMKILPFGDACLFGTEKVWIDGKEMKIEAFSERPNGLFLKLVGVDDVSAAMSFKNKEIQIPVDEAKKIVGEDKFLWGDVFDAKIILKQDESQEEIGVAADIDNFGSADIVTCNGKGGKTFSFPIVKGLLISLENGKMVLDKRRFEEVVCYEN